MEVNNDPFQEKIDKMRREIKGDIVHEDSYVYNNKQRVHILIEHHLWYHVHALFESDNKLNLSLRCKIGESITLNSALATSERFIKTLKKTENSHKTGLDQYGDFYCDFKFVNGEDIYSNPDKYLNIADHIFIQRKKIYHHHGIFAGNNRVIHISQSQPGQGKQGSTLLEHDWEKFLTKNPGVITLRMYALHRDRESIIENARQLVDKKFRRGKYDIIKMNCEAFPHYIWTGKDFSSQVRWIFRKFNVLRFFFNVRYIIKFKPF